MAEHLKEIDVEPNAIVLEPVARNTAPAALIAALMCEIIDPNGLILLLPSDHLFTENETFHNAVYTAIDSAKEGNIVTFGIDPSEPETGFGYIKTVKNGAVVREVGNFIEKPQYEVAEKMLADDRFLWNSGIFLYSAATMIKAFEDHMSNTLNACREALVNSVEDLEFLTLDEESYSRAENISIDYGIMEKIDNIFAVPISTEWSDMGSWKALWTMANKDDYGNANDGDVLLLDSKNSYFHKVFN